MSSASSSRIESWKTTVDVRPECPEPCQHRLYLANQHSNLVSTPQKLLAPQLRRTVMEVRKSYTLTFSQLSMVVPPVAVSLTCQACGIS
ncbi:hypothetical protein D8674_034052 [Pyrus ussuriensis x Pyrus communis]|uniref:Uncharacterized protein n=1 Tax=Pyrus ussuriensis x Pyrus communis TaxID=2448454 RepID=A0A5N5HQZ1_9ROSA|nr:hypothetical protein D8674_034052 [Pyrus ussuriensis x Pyrus communis]